MCSGSVVVTAYGSESGRQGSNHEWGLIYYKFLNFFEGGHLLDCDASIIVCGDFNIPSNRKLSRFLDLMTERGFNQCVNTPTRDSNILDLVFVIDSFAVSDCCCRSPVLYQ